MNYLYANVSICTSCDVQATLELSSLILPYKILFLTFEYFFVDRTPDGPSFSMTALQLTLVSMSSTITFNMFYSI